MARGQHLLCAKRCVEGKVYCEKHWKMAFVPLRPRKP